MQDNYNWCGPSAVRGTAGIARFHWWTIQGGDGFVVLQDPSDYRIAFSESQDGNIVRVDRVTGETLVVRPLAGPGEPAIRWNWDTPMAMSPHDPKVIYAGANRLFRSTNRGLSWTPVSRTSEEPEPRRDRDDGDEEQRHPHRQERRHRGVGNDLSFAESPKRAGVLYTGSDDGNLHVSRDGGKDWASVSERSRTCRRRRSCPRSCRRGSTKRTVYATFDGHRNNDFETYIYASTDYGQNWRSISANLKGEVVRTLTEDLKNPDVLYLGTETGLFVTIDRGRSWQRIKANLPTVRIDEITLHPRDNAMILGTHGRVIWVLDNMSPIQEYAAAQSAAADAKLFAPAPARCTGGPRVTATTSSGGSRSSTARTRRRRR